MSDPVAAKSSWLSAYMSQHADTLVAYILQELHRQQRRNSGKNVSLPSAGEVKNPKMLSITSDKMQLQYEDASDGQKVKTVDVAFDPPLAGYEEVRPRLLQMKGEAENAIGMAKAPQVDFYRFPARRNAMSTILLLGLWLGCALQDDGTRGTFVRIRNLVGGMQAVEYTGYFIVRESRSRNRT